MSFWPLRMIEVNAGFQVHLDRKRISFWSISVHEISFYAGNDNDKCVQLNSDQWDEWHEE
jgi:hypothetical protein